MQTMIVVGGEALVDLVIDPEGSGHGEVGWRAVQRGAHDRTVGQRVAFLGALSRRPIRIAAASPACWPTTSTTRWCSSPSLPTTLAAAELDEHGAATYHFYLAETAAPNLHPLPLPSDVTHPPRRHARHGARADGDGSRGPRRQHRRRRARAVGSQLSATRHA